MAKANRRRTEIPPETIDFAKILVNGLRIGLTQKEVGRLNIKTYIEIMQATISKKGNVDEYEDALEW